MNNDRSKCIMAGLGRYELTLLEKQFVGRVKEYIQNNTGGECMVYGSLLLNS